jgi:hypothetical protein
MLLHLPTLIILRLVDPYASIPLIMMIGLLSGAAQYSILALLISRGWRKFKARRKG